MKKTLSLIFILTIITILFTGCNTETNNKTVISEITKEEKISSIKIEKEINDEITEEIVEENKIEETKTIETKPDETLEYNSLTSKKDGKYCTSTGQCFEEYEDFLDKELENYAKELTKKYNYGKAYEIKTRLVDPLFHSWYKNTIEV